MDNTRQRKLFTKFIVKWNTENPFNAVTIEDLENRRSQFKKDTDLFLKEINATEELSESIRKTLNL